MFLHIREQELRRLIPKREHKAIAPARLGGPPRPDIVRPAGNGRWRKWLLWTLLLSAVVAVATGFWFQVDIWPPSLFNQTISSAFQTVRYRFERKDGAHTPYLIFENSKASINHPLPLGIVLNNSVNEETVVLNGLIEGTSLSAGTALTATRWSLPGRDLDKTFISAPENFEGVMEVIVTLYSSRQDILETKQVRFEWSGSSKGDKLPITISPAQRLSR
jgi:hypothetical protein